LTGFALSGAAALVAAVVRIERATAKPVIGYAPVAACILALASRTFARNFDWQNAHTIWSAALRVCPRSFNVHKGYATSLISEPLREADLDLAITHLEQARALLENPPLPIEREDNTVWPVLGKYYRVKAEHCAARGDTTAAVRWAERSRVVLEKSVAVNRWSGAEVKRRYVERGDAEAAARSYGNPQIFLELAVTQLRLNRSQEAETTLNERRRIDPHDSETLVLLGLIARDRGDMDRAAARFMQAVFLANNNERAWRELADTYARLGIVPPPITLRASGGHIEGSIPRVRGHLDMALVELVQAFRAVGRAVDAETWQGRAVREYGCRPELFN
jgi:tetratricopeptide (TPR) repeat protein